MPNPNRDELLYAASAYVHNANAISALLDDAGWPEDEVDSMCAQAAEFFCSATELLNQANSQSPDSL